MYRLRLFYVARLFLRAFGRRGEGAAVLFHPKGARPHGGPTSASASVTPRGGHCQKEGLWTRDY